MDDCLDDNWVCGGAGTRSHAQPAAQTGREESRAGSGEHHPRENHNVDQKKAKNSSQSKQLPDE